ncbi:MAG: tetratricopeptide repeat protein [Deltaproteobacteria bacterium]|nr:tetratricopeptide repeat protein [Deltaproteobacteria bacterium]
MHHSFRRRCPSLLASLVAVTLIGAVAPSAQAQTRPPAASPTAEVRELFRRGTAAFDARDFETALRSYQSAYIASEQPEFLLNIASCFEQLNRLPDARASLQRYLDTAQNIPDRARLEARIRELDARIQGTAVVTPPVVTPPVVTPPVVTPPRVAPPPPAAPAWPWVLVGVGGAMMAGAIIPLVLTPDPSHCMGQAAGSPSCTEHTYLDQLGRANTYPAIGATLLGVGGALAITGLITAIVLRPSTTQESSPRTALRITPTSIEVSGAF